MVAQAGVRAPSSGIPAGMVAPVFPPGSAMVQPGGAPMLPQPALTLQQQAAASQARLQALQAERRAVAAAAVPSHPIIKPTIEEDKEFQPAPRLAGLVREACTPGCKLGSDTLGDAAVAMKLAAADFVSGAAAFAGAMAKRRKAESVDPADLLLYFERTWWVAAAAGGVVEAGAEVGQLGGW